MSRQRIIAATLAWLAVVASVSALVWVVISRAGDDLVTSDQQLSTTAEQTAPAPQGTSARPSRSPRASPSDEASSSPEASPSPEPSPSSSPSPSSPSSSPSPSSPSSSSSPTEGAVTEQRRTWQGQAGSIVAACGATGIRLVSAQPADGFRAEAHTDDGALEIEFEGREDRAGTDAKVVARCVGGVPTFVVESDD